MKVVPFEGEHMPELARHVCHQDPDELLEMLPGDPAFVSRVDVGGHVAQEMAVDRSSIGAETCYSLIVSMGLFLFEC